MSLWTAALQAPLSSTPSRSCLKFISVESAPPQSPPPSSIMLGLGIWHKNLERCKHLAPSRTSPKECGKPSRSSWEIPLATGDWEDKHRRLFTYTNTTDKHPGPPLPASSWQWRGRAISHPGEPPPRWGSPSSFCPSSFATGLRLNKLRNSDFAFFLWVWLWHRHDKSMTRLNLWHYRPCDQWTIFLISCSLPFLFYFTFLTLKILFIFGLAVSLLLHMVSLAVASKPLTAVVSLVSEHGLQALRLRQLRLTGSGMQAQ